MNTEKTNLSSLRSGIVGVQFLFVAFGATVLVPLLVGLMLLLFGTIATAGVSNMLKNMVDLSNTRNIVIFSMTMTLGIGCAAFTWGDFSLPGI